MRLDLDDTDFRARLACWLRELSNEVITDLNLVFDQSSGVYPTTLLKLWHRELHRRSLKPHIAEQRSAPDVGSPDGQLPVGHPVDSDWRFTSVSVLELVRLALDGLPAGEPVAHLGAPTTFLHCARSDPQRQHVLLDRNTTVLDALVNRGISSPHLMIGIDMQDVRWLHLAAGAAIVDPPWYLEDTLLFLRVAAEVCRPDATVVLCQPTGGTRPGVEEERALLLDRVSALGLDLYALRSGGVRYLTPHFEAVSLRAATCGASIPTSWRRGDVLLFKRLSGPVTILQHSAHGQQWREVHFGPVRVKLAERPTGTDVGSLVHGDVLTTVSRRDPVRKRIGMWTSGNRIFALANPLTIGQLITLCDGDLMENAFSLHNTLVHANTLGVSRDVAARLHHVLLVELTEHRKYGGTHNA
ncbi:MAG: hypothetical protein ACRDR6_04155 [Pseudonocardiaceae bacterium]